MRIAKHKPVEYKVLEWTGSNSQEVQEFTQIHFAVFAHFTVDKLRLHTDAGPVDLDPGDFIVSTDNLLGSKGRFKVYSPEEFAQSFEFID